MAAFRWTEKAEQAAIALANGSTRDEAAAIAGIGQRTLYNWLNLPEFSEEVDRLTFLTGVAHKAERLRLAKRVIASLQTFTEKDLLDWLKFVQSETDGIKLDFAGLFAALAANDEPMANGGSNRVSGPDRVDAIVHRGASAIDRIPA